MGERIISEKVATNRWQNILRWEYLGLLIIVAVTLAFHGLAINRPASQVWDEMWYVGDARSIISGTGDLRQEHPPLAKLFIVAGEYLLNGFKAPEKNTGIITNQQIGAGFGDTSVSVNNVSDFKVGTTIRIDAEQMIISSVDAANNRLSVLRGAGGSVIAAHTGQAAIFLFYDNPLEWRLFSVIFGTASIVIFYFICRKLKLSWKAAAIGTFLFAFENMTFIHSGLALLDVFMVAFILAAVLSYLDEKYLLTGLLIALAALCKLNGVLIIIAIVLHCVFYRRDRIKQLAGSLIIAAITFVLLLVFCDFLITGGLENPITRLQVLFSKTGSLLFTVPKTFISSRPWTWLYPQWFDLSFNSSNVPFIAYSYDPQYVSFISTTIQLLIIPTVCYMIYRTIKGSKTAGYILLWFAATYLVLIPLNIVSNRVTYVYYFLSTTPAICIGIAIALSDILDKIKASRLRHGKTTGGAKAVYLIVAFYLAAHLAIFVVFNPAVPTIIKTWLPPFSLGIPH